MTHGPAADIATGPAAAHPTGPARRALPTVRAVRELPVDAPTVWRTLTDARRHAAWIPLTRVSTSTAEPALGTEVTAVSGPGAVRGGPGVVDRMWITRFDPPGATTPGTADFTKLGPVLLGRARIEVTPLGPRRSRLVWSEAVHLVGPWPRLTGYLVSPVLDAMLQLAVRRAVRELTTDATNRR
ncbi:SRPBCC family protein [Cellulomonas hominis]